jgi:hypothetical protein
MSGSLPFPPEQITQALRHFQPIIKTRLEAEERIVKLSLHNFLAHPGCALRGVMTDIRLVIYPHRRKLDGSFDSICLNCMSTVANSMDETELVKFDNAHVCAVPLITL